MAWTMTICIDQKAIIRIYPCIYSIFANFAPDEQNRGITYIGLQA